MLAIDVWPPAKEFIESISSKHARQVIKRIERLADNPLPPQSKLLEGYAPLRRLRSGDYRIIYFVHQNVLKVPLVDRRNDDKIYHRLKQMFG
ncbi:hypothetical protein A3C21_03885 [Candidatus Kaiserbacteria bacterium RIFCSPHIGHO2_02_FULL_59_21]|uniref:Plasmid stabilization protein n=1 Tax=Candidatus Kaiserbacteria bacterium RIFCSPHIGHO2_02_FULL_59_21 TaxID=1798500 RepID=A0A1F6E1Q2_9BACT|nr:MAG: hypothetical protein A2766_02375 [Candidatus Kaiserbacteria bacterium RIFCSPHIGHO2_01_FULL_58_22]OGG67591.1 MAG: hypothetical protein A3C21_03885 [Candidatus Kaiserbacteria bacterium RIFCSPHIGHO2_02_FULL_59_21]OGG80661.1 MAG: hypothetical protein A2952_02540 [Candidatus Kaiserbacteria bacterium RIFCSPLOWO2_01_FULL_59_34]OGG85444.1 MAG: hypothetical protein A3I47_03720 [Candidatus Kaiserbacteria bacterium RIFCSPLOWO2_02_FULL_59_19]